MSTHEANPFLFAFHGRLLGIRSWADLDRLWAAVRRDAQAGWHLYTLEQGPPAGPSASEEVEAFITNVDARLRREHRADYCGFVYADSPDSPTFIKAYEPSKYSGCGHGPGPALPGWILSKAPPVDIVAILMPAAPRPWWRRALGHIGGA